MAEDSRGVRRAVAQVAAAAAATALAATGRGPKAEREAGILKAVRFLCVGQWPKKRAGRGAGSAASPCSAHTVGSLPTARARSHAEKMRGLGVPRRTLTRHGMVTLTPHSRSLVFQKTAAAFAAAADSAWLASIPDAPTYYPTPEQAADPIGFIRSIAAEVSLCGERDRERGRDSSFDLVPTPPPPPACMPLSCPRLSSCSFHARTGICKIVPPFPAAGLQLDKVRRRGEGKRERERGRHRTVRAALTSPSPSKKKKQVLRGEVDGSNPLDPSPTFKTRLQPVALQEWKPPLNTAVWWEVGKPHTLASYEAEASKYTRAVTGSSLATPPVRVVEADLWRARSEAGTSDRAALARVRDGKGADGGGGSGGGGSGGSGGGGSGSADRGVRHVAYGDNVHGSLFLERSTTPASGGNATAPASPAPEGSTCPLSDSPWNLRGFARLPGCLTANAPDIPGVTTPMLYIGMLHASFAWHVEDHNLFSINYGHAGAPKVWYGVPASGADAFEDVAAERVYTRPTLGLPPGGRANKAAARAKAAAALADKTTIFSPRLLVEAGVDVFRAVQEAGTYIITFPRAYHGGFSAGFHIGEAVNFATPEWLPWGGMASASYGVRVAAPILHLERVLVDALARLALSELGKRPRGEAAGARARVGPALARRAALSAAEGTPVGPAAPPLHGDAADRARLAASERAAILMEAAVQLAQLEAARADLEGEASACVGGGGGQAGPSAPTPIPLAPREAVSRCAACGQGAVMLRVFVHGAGDCTLCARCAAGGEGPLPPPPSQTSEEAPTSSDDEGDPATAAAAAARAALTLPLPPGAGALFTAPEFDEALAAFKALTGSNPADFARAIAARDLLLEVVGLDANRAVDVPPPPLAPAAYAATRGGRGGGGGGGGRAAAAVASDPTPSPAGRGLEPPPGPTPAAAHPPRTRPGTAPSAASPPSRRPAAAKAADGGQPAPARAAAAAPEASPRRPGSSRLRADPERDAAEAAPDAAAAGPPAPTTRGRPQRAAAAAANERLREAASAEAGGGGLGGAPIDATPPRRPAAPPGGGLTLSPPARGGGGKGVSGAGSGGGGGSRKRRAPTPTPGGGGGGGGRGAPSASCTPSRPSKRLNGGDAAAGPASPAAPAAGSSKPTPRRRAAAAKAAEREEDERRMKGEGERGNARARAPAPPAPAPADSDATITVDGTPPPPPPQAASPPPPPPKAVPVPAAAPPAQPTPTTATHPPIPLPKGAAYVVDLLPPPLSRPRPPGAPRAGPPAGTPLARYQRRVFARAPGSAYFKARAADAAVLPDLSPTAPGDRLLALADVVSAWTGGGSAAGPAGLAWVTAVAWAGVKVVTPPVRLHVRGVAKFNTSQINALTRAAVAKLYAALQDPGARARLAAFVEGVWPANPCGEFEDFLLTGYLGKTPAEAREGAGGGPYGGGDGDAEDGEGGEDVAGTAAAAKASPPVRSPPRVMATPPRPTAPLVTRDGKDRAALVAKRAAAVEDESEEDEESEEGEASEEEASEEEEMEEEGEGAASEEEEEFERRRRPKAPRAPPNKRTRAATPPPPPPPPPPVPPAPAPAKAREASTMPRPAPPPPSPPPATTASAGWGNARTPPRPPGGGPAAAVDDDLASPIIATKRRPGLAAHMSRLSALGVHGAAGAGVPVTLAPAVAAAAAAATAAGGSSAPSAPLPVTLPVTVVPNLGPRADRTPVVVGVDAALAVACAAAPFPIKVDRLMSSVGVVCDAAGKGGGGSEFTGSEEVTN